MTRHLPAALLLALATASLPAAAGPQTIEVPSTALRSVTDQEVQDLKGRYWMSDGRMLKLRRAGLRFVAELEGEPTTELRALSSQQLVSANGRMHLRFSGDELVSNVTLVIGPSMAGASGPVVAQTALTSGPAPR